MKTLKSLERLQESLAKLPGIGKRTAERMSFAMLDMDEEDLKEFSTAILGLKRNIKKCPICGNLTEGKLCEICLDDDRDQSVIMVVSSPRDVISLEETGQFNGLYHVLGGNISLANPLGVESLNIPSLINRISDGKVKEIILATNTTIEGETTALYISKLLNKFNISITRLAYGLPMGGNLDYADSMTLTKAIEGRRKI